MLRERTIRPLDRWISENSRPIFYSRARALSEILLVRQESIVKMNKQVQKKMQWKKECAQIDCIVNLYSAVGRFSSSLNVIDIIPIWMKIRIIAIKSGVKNCNKCAQKRNLGQLKQSQEKISSIKPRIINKLWFN